MTDIPFKYVVRGGTPRVKATKRSWATSHDPGSPTLANHGFRVFRPVFEPHHNTHDERLLALSAVVNAAKPLMKPLTLHFANDATFIEHIIQLGPTAPLPEWTQVVQNPPLSDLGPPIAMTHDSLWYSAWEWGGECPHVDGRYIRNVVIGEESGSAEDERDFTLGA